MTRRWWAVGILGVAGVLLSAAGLSAKPGLVTSTTGQTYWGDIDDTSTPGKLIITGRGVFTPKGASVALSRQAVGSVVYFNTPREEFDAVMAKLAPADATGRVALAQWAESNNQGALAREAAESALVIDPNNAEAKAVIERVGGGGRVAGPRPGDTQPAAAGGGAGAAGAGVGAGVGARPDTGVRPGAVAGAGRPAGGAAAGAGAARGVGAATRQVTAEEINMIRQAEWRANDRTVRAQVPPDVRKRFIEMGVVPADVQAARLSPADLAMAVLQYGTPAMKREVKIQNDPQALAAFRTMVNRVLQTGCVQCHAPGKVAPGNNFVLFPENTDAAVYSNFVVLNTHQVTVGDATQPLIDRTRPEGSLLLQYALPPDFANTPHPEVPPPSAPYRGAVRNATVPQFRGMLQWISYLNPVPPDYQVDLTTAAPEPGADDARPAGRGRADAGGGAGATGGTMVRPGAGAP